jgi:hypothetical protein
MGGEGGLEEGAQANIKETHALVARPSQRESPFLTTDNYHLPITNHS